MCDLAKLVIKRFPENRNMQLVCLRTAAYFACSRCKKTKKAKLFAVVADDWDRLLCNGCYEEVLSQRPEEPVEDAVPRAWLGAVVSVQDAEKDNLVMGVPFGNQSLVWEDFKAAVIEGDVVCEFASPPESFEHSNGRAGYALIRDGVPVKCIVTMP